MPIPKRSASLLVKGQQMAIHSIWEREVPYRNQPGRCPMCGVDVRPRDQEVGGAGVWDGVDSDGRRCGGPLFAVNCSSCGTTLNCHLSLARWQDADPSKVIWQRSYRQYLVGGDRWRGRPGAWEQLDVQQVDQKFSQLLAQSDSVDDAIRSLHLIAGLGALHLCGVVERVVGVSALEAKKRVVRAMLDSWDEQL